MNRNIDENSGFNNSEDNFILIVDAMDKFYDSRRMRRLRCRGLSRSV